MGSLAGAEGPQVPARAARERSSIGCLALEPDHILITGDLTTTALAGRVPRGARRALEPLLADSGKVTVIPGNHDRYTVGAHRDRRFEQYFGDFAPASVSLAPHLDPQTAILGLDPTRAA